MIIGKWHNTSGLARINFRDYEINNMILIWRDKCIIFKWRNLLYESVWNSQRIYEPHYVDMARLHFAL